MARPRAAVIKARNRVRGSVSSAGSRAARCRSTADTLNLVFDAGSEVTPEVLRERGLVRETGIPVKVLGRGDISKKLTVRAHKFSGTAAEKIAAAGGTTEVIGA